MRAMAIVARNLESVSLVVVAGETLPLPDPAEVFAHFTGAEAKAARMLDDAALHLRSFLLPGVDMRIIFEPTRVRFEALNPKKPSEEKFAERAAQSLHALYPKRPFPRIRTQPSSPSHAPLASENAQRSFRTFYTSNRNSAYLPQQRNTTCKSRE
jgi:hypothetical protein